MNDFGWVGLYVSVIEVGYLTLLSEKNFLYIGKFNTLCKTLQLNRVNNFNC